MKTLPQQFPHIYRFFTAGVGFSKKHLPFFFLIIYLFFSLLDPQSEFEKTKLKVISDPNNSRTHLLLSQIFLDHNDFENALNEAKITQGREQLDKIEMFRQKPSRLQKQLSYWNDILTKHPNYRDGFLQKAALEWQLKDEGLARVDLKKAIELDPNFEASLKLAKVFKLN